MYGDMFRVRVEFQQDDTLVRFGDVFFENAAVDGRGLE